MPLSDRPDSAVAGAFAHDDVAVRSALLRLRRLIGEAAHENPQIGPLSEQLKWGQPSYTPVRPRIGSSVRIGTLPDGEVALFFICHTRLVDRFRRHYHGTLSFKDNRAIGLAPDGDWPEAELRHCIAMALTFHLEKRRQRSGNDG